MTINADVQRVRAADAGDRFMLLPQVEAATGATAFAQALSARTMTGELEVGMKELRAALLSLEIGPPTAGAAHCSPERRAPCRPTSSPSIRPSPSSEP